MCGRFTLSHPQALPAVFAPAGLPAPDVETLFPTPRYNIAPGQAMPALCLGVGPGLEWRPLVWGLVPSWAKEKEGRKPRPLVNARAETAPALPSFRGPFRRRRCLVPADGFFEWKARAGGKQPYLFRLRSGGGFALAGLWDEWRGVEGFCLLTTGPNELVRPVHDRMPVILVGEVLTSWLDPTRHAEDLGPLLAPFPAGEMAAVPVSPRVNSPRNDDPGCVEPTAA
jgi:putative SOS response-associated peptidase YedK